MDNTEEAPPWTPPSPDALSGEFPNLEIRSLLAVGGMSAVYLVRQLSLDRLAVLKLLPSQTGTNPEATVRFQTEARALASVRDSGVVEVYDFGSTAGGYLYLLLEYEAGGDLRSWVRNRRTPVTAAEVLDIGVSITGGIAAAHRKGIIHGDIKPDNIFLDDRGRLKVGDFGLAGSSGSSTATHHTPGYTAPEILAGHRLSTPQSDLYAVGASLFELLLGSPPPEDAAGRPAALSALPRPVAEVIAWALKEDPAERPATAEAFQQALATARTRLAEAAAPKPRPTGGPAPVVVLQPSAQGRRRGKPSSGSAGKSGTPIIAAAVLVVLIGGGFFFSRPASPVSKTVSPPASSLPAAASDSQPPPSVAFPSSDKSTAPPSVASHGVLNPAPISGANSAAAASQRPPAAAGTPDVQPANSGIPAGSGTAFGSTGPAATSGIQTVMNDLNGKPAEGENPDEAWLEEGTEKLTGSANTDASSSVTFDGRGKVLGVPATDAEITAWNADWKVNAPRGTTDDAARFSTNQDDGNNVLILAPFSQTVPATLTRQMTLPADKPMQLGVRVRNKPVSTADWVLKAFVNGQPLSPPSEISIHQGDRQFEELTWDLSPWKGKNVTLRLESHAGGTNPWIWEHSYWSWIKVGPLDSVLAHAKYNPSQASKGPVESGFVDLFGPAQAASWRGTETGGLSFDSGVATVYTRPGTPRKGLIWFPKRMFRDFVLKADFKMDTARADSGIWLRVPEPGKSTEAAAASDSGEGPVELKIRGYSVSRTGTGSLADKAAPTSLPLNQNDWNRFEITVVGTRHLVKLNGVLINEYTGGTGEPGYLALQHARTDGGVHFRNVWIKELTTPAAAQAVLTQPAGAGASAARPAASKNRPLGVPGDAREFQGRWYRYYPEKLLWRMAKKRCEDLRGHLAKVPDAATNQFLTELCADNSAWLGATDEKSEGQWVWLDGSPVDYKNWGDGQPDNKHDREDFLGFWAKGKWNDAPNDHPEIRGFVCEWN